MLVQRSVWRLTMSCLLRRQHLPLAALQELLNRGWRRSGCWLYKPDLRETCCPPYTIRLDVHRFQPSKVRKDGYGHSLRPARACLDFRHSDGGLWQLHVLFCRACEARRVSSVVCGWQLTSCGCCDQSQRQVQRRFEAYLTGKPLPGQRVSSDSPMSASGSASQGHQNNAAQHGKPGRKQPPIATRPTSAEERSHGVENLVSAFREAVASCVASGLLPEARYPPPLVQAPSAKQAKLLPSTVRCVPVVAYHMMLLLPSSTHL